MNIQTIKTTTGEELVVLPMSEYENLLGIVEERIDLQQCEKIMASIANGDETYPQELITKLVDGKPPITVFREYRKLTMQQLADKASVSKSYISRIESGDKTGTIDTLKTIANVLKIDIDMIV